MPLYNLVGGGKNWEEKPLHIGTENRGILFVLLTKCGHLIEANVDLKTEC